MVTGAPHPNTPWSPGGAAKQKQQRNYLGKSKASCFLILLFSETHFWLDLGEEQQSVIVATDIEEQFLCCDFNLFLTFAVVSSMQSLWCREGFPRWMMEVNLDPRSFMKRLLKRRLDCSPTTALLVSVIQPTWGLNHIGAWMCHSDATQNSVFMSHKHASPQTAFFGHTLEWSRKFFFLRNNDARLCPKFFSFSMPHWILVTFRQLFWASPNTMHDYLQWSDEAREVRKTSRDHSRFCLSWCSPGDVPSPPLSLYF